MTKKTPDAFSGIQGEGCFAAVKGDKTLAELRNCLMFIRTRSRSGKTSSGRRAGVFGHDNNRPRRRSIEGVYMPRSASWRWKTIFCPARSPSGPAERKAMIDRGHDLSIVRRRRS